MPTRPPYEAHLGNLSFEITERDIESLLGSLKIVSIRIPLHRETKKPRGFGYVEFEDVESLAEAVKMDGFSVLKRPIRITVNEQAAERHSSSRGFRNDKDDKFNSNWRSTARPLSPQARESPFGIKGRRTQQNGFAEPVGDKRRQGAAALHKASDSAASSEAGTLVDRESASPEAIAPVVSKKPAFNPFGSAKPRDENEIMRKLEERRAQRQAEGESEEQTPEAQEPENTIKEQEEKRRLPSPSKKPFASRPPYEQHKGSKREAPKKPFEPSHVDQGNWRQKPPIDPSANRPARNNVFQDRFAKTNSNKIGFESKSKGSAFKRRDESGFSDPVYGKARSSANANDDAAAVQVKSKNVFDLLEDE